MAGTVGKIMAKRLENQGKTSVISRPVPPWAKTAGMPCVKHKGKAFCVKAIVTPNNKKS